MKIGMPVHWDVFSMCIENHENWGILRYLKWAKFSQNFLEPRSRSKLVKLFLGVESFNFYFTLRKAQSYATPNFITTGAL